MGRNVLPDEQKKVTLYVGVQKKHEKDAKKDLKEIERKYNPKQSDSQVGESGVVCSQTDTDQ